MANIKEVEIKGKKYKLTANRKLIKVIADICPEMLKLNQDNANDSEQVKLGVNIIADLDIIFYEMLKPAQPDISKETADKILESFEEEYADVANNLITFAMSSFIQGDQTTKKQLNW